MRQRTSVVEWPYRKALLLMIVVSGLSGCTLFNRTVDHLNTVYENRCNDLTGACAPVVSLDPPQGYLAEGAEFAGTEITGPAGKTAVDRVVELSKEVEDLRRESDSLREQLDLARTTIDQQASTIDGASKELQLAMNDYSMMRESLTKWQSDLKEFEVKYHDEQDVQDTAWDDLERQLQAMIRRCESAAQSPVRADREPKPAEQPHELEAIPKVEPEEEAESEAAAILPLSPPSGVSLLPPGRSTRDHDVLIDDEPEREPELLPVSLEGVP